MKRNKDFGQESVEFVILTGLVFLVSIGIILIFGNKLSDFFKNSAAMKQSTNTSSAIISSNTSPRYTSTPNAPVAIAGYQVTINDDGSASFVVNGQKVTISAEAANLQNAVTQTTGSSGLEYLVKEIADMINKHASEYPSQSVPLELVFGPSTKVNTLLGGKINSYAGTGTASATQIKVGNDFVIIQKDQSSDCNVLGICDLDLENVYRIEGTINSDNSFSATTTTYNDTGIKGDFTGNLDTNGVFTGSLGQTVPTILLPLNFTYDFSVDFSNPKNSFSL